MAQSFLLLTFTVTLACATTHKHCDTYEEWQNDATVRNLTFFPEYDQRIFSDFSVGNQMYSLHNRVTFTMHDVIEDEETTTFCLSVVSMKSETVDKETNTTLSTVEAKHYMGSVHVGILNVKTQCWDFHKNPAKCDTEIRIFDEIMNVPIFVYSPLTEEFWRNMNDEIIFHSNLIEELNVTMYGQSIPPSWVSFMEISSLSKFIISGNNWTRPGRLLGKLPTLSDIELVNNNIEVLDNDTFGGTEILSLLSLQYNYIHNLSIPVELLRNMRDLHVIGRDGATNSIVFSMSNGELMAMHNLESLNIAHYHANMNISLVLQDLNLRHISITYAQLSHIEDNTKAVISPYHALRHLYLHYNHLTTLPPTIFSQLTNVINLKLNNNRFKDCQKDAVGHMSGLQYLNWANNNISELAPECFLKLRRLKKLDVSWNSITILNASTFRYCNGLVSIKLSNNNIHFISNDVFAHLEQLTHMLLSYNELKHAPHCPRKRFNKLDLSHNQIEEFLFVNDSYVEHVDLSWNSLKLVHVTKIAVLNLSYNSLVHLPDRFRASIPFILSVDLGGNHFSCCNTETITHLLSSQNIINLNTRDPLMCSIAEHGVWDVPVTEFARNDSLCVKPLPDNALETHEIALQIGVPLAILLLTIAILTFVIRHYSVQASFVYDFFRLKKMGFSSHQRYEESSYDAFVCYSGNSFSWIINELLPNLEGTSDRYRLCLHDRDFTLGVGIDRNILASLDKSRRVMFLLTNEFLHSSWGRWELEMANHRIFQEERGYIILIELEPLLHHQLPKTLSSLMSTRTYVKWPTEPSHSQRIRRYWERLRTALGESIAHKTGREADTGRTVMDA